ncbi:MAG: U32 family peptidase [Alphaproteobacteria bacterium]|nr:U32 family peptidase [Alphaproteobacteria bacterium]
MIPRLTLGPLFFHWPAETMRDFYFRIADEAPFSCVYLGQVICSKRESFFTPYFHEVIERLHRGGKEIILSSLAMLTQPREIKALHALAQEGFLIEANDVAAIQILKDRPFVVGPFINVLNEGAMTALIQKGATRFCFASELSAQSLQILAAHAPQTHKEVLIFGRQPLAIAMRCYHARAHGKTKDECRFACADDPDGLAVSTLSGQKLLAINGTQTLSHDYLVLLDEAQELACAGVTYFRISPHHMDMTALARLYEGFLAGRISGESVLNRLKELKESLKPLNGYYHGQAGLSFVAKGK